MAADAADADDWQDFGRQYADEADGDTLYVHGVDTAGGTSAAELAAGLARFWETANERWRVAEYVWHRDRCHLQVVDPSTQDGPTVSRHPYLSGTICFGDNVDDEWFIVFLVFELSKQLKSLTFHVSDTDGEFLLIEAALVIPRWLKPSNSANRVFISRGKLVYVPLVASGTTLPKKLSLAQGFELISNPAYRVVADDMVQSCIQDRISVMAEAVSRSTHRARCIVPLTVAKLLTHCPHALPHAVLAFHHRDAADTAIGNRMSTLGVAMPTPIVLRFTRALYAQLALPMFHMPPVLQRAMSSTEADAVDNKAVTLGSRLAVGMEILCHQAVRTFGNTSSSDAGLEAAIHQVQQTDMWTRFKASLNATGYFAQLHPGTDQYLAKERAAAVRLLETTDFVARDDQDVMFQLAHALSHLDDITAQTNDGMPVDSDAWLQESDRDLELLLAQREAQLKEFETRTGVATHVGTSAQDIATSMAQFVEKLSGVEGVQVRQPSADDGGSTDSEDLDDATDDDSANAGESDDDHDAPVDIDLENLVRVLRGEPMSVPADRTVPPNHDAAPDEATLHDVMSAMDAQLDRTEMGKSFERAPDSIHHSMFSEESDGASVDSDDVSAAQPHAPKPLHERKDDNEEEDDDDDDDDDDDNDDDDDDDDEGLPPVSVNLNLVKNLMESVASQQGLAGPSTNLLGELGLAVPRDWRISP